MSRFVWSHSLRTGVSLVLLSGLVPLACGPSADSDGPWPNEPGGYTVYSDWTMDSAPPANIPDGLIPGTTTWRARTGLPGDPDGWVELASDASGAHSATGVYQFAYPTGMRDGAGPGRVWSAIPDYDRVYVGFWWKLSDPWQYHDVGDKLGYLWAGSSNMFLIQYGSPHKLAAYVQFSGSQWLYPNVNATTVTRGVWHRVELFAQYIPGQKGRVKWWLDGVLQGDYGTWSAGGIPGPFTEWSFDPVWGGNNGSVKGETDYFWFDDIHISGQ